MFLGKCFIVIIVAWANVIGESNACPIIINRQGTGTDAFANIMPSNEQIQDTLVSVSNAILEQQALRYKNYIQGIKTTLPTDCDDVSRMGQRSTGVYTIYPAGSVMGLPVRCDMASDGGGWTVIQRRVNGSTDFQQTWYNYQMGFGSPGHEYWLGNELIHIMTTQSPYQLIINMTDSNGKEEFVTYSHFNVSDSHDGYRLFVDGFSTSSDLKDRLSNRHNHMKFSTVDNDQDTDDNQNCAKVRIGGWWFKNCNDAFLNGVYGATDFTTGIYWTIYTNQLQFVEMKIRKLTDV